MRNVWKLMLMLLVLVACQNTDPPKDPLFKPENTFGGTVPADAQVVTPEEFKTLSTSEGFKIDTLKLRADRKVAVAAQFKTDTDEIKRLAAQSPAYNKALTEPDTSDGTLKILPDGNYLITVQGNKGAFEVVALVGSQF